MATVTGDWASGVGRFQQLGLQTPIRPEWPEMFRPPRSLVNSLEERKAVMTRNISTRCVAGALLLASGCAPLPTMASRVDGSTSVRHSASASVRLSNLNGRYLGPVNKLCGAGTDTKGIDELSFDYEVSAGDLSGALLVKCDSGNCMSGIPLGTVTICPVRPKPCEAEMIDLLDQGLAPACLRGDPTATGSVEVLAAVAPVREESTYLVMAFFEETGKRSNTVSTIVGHQIP